MENLEVGMKLHAMWLNWRYYYAEIINIKKKKKKAPVKVHYMGYEGFDAWLSLDMLKCKALKGASKALAKEKAKVAAPKVQMDSGLEKGRLQAEAEGKYAAEDGSLDTAFAEAKGEDLENLRKAAAHTLLLAAADGRLEEVLQGGPPPLPDKDNALRQQARQLLTQAAQEAIKSITAMMLPVSRRGRSRSPRIRRQRERKKRGRSPGDLLRLDQTECLRRPRSLQLK
ncbi:unnamed protein product [Durusdinium trenchii]|uniref:Tudor-knot domain-containing protein n=1 Tax=Durusdinium trenchii TaxID=1381693 RepID=A0ABP0HG61_9DINO